MEKLNNIDAEAQLINSLLQSAKMGEWQEVWNIIGTPSHPRKTYLINVIPENRRWGIIHQAVYWRNKDVICKLLKLPGCDKDARTKACTSECGDTSRQTAAEVAASYGYLEIKEMLEAYKSAPTAMSQTFQAYEGYNEKESLGLITITLGAYKKTFHPSPVNSNKDVVNVLSDIWNDMQKSKTRWVAIRDIVADSVYIVDPENSKLIKKSSSLEGFFKSFIQTYTVEENFMYTYLSEALRRQTPTNTSLTGDDLALGPYAVVYQMLLLFWPEIPRETRPTYRRMLLSKADCDKYNVGTKFVWQSVVSSSSEEECAVPFPTCNGVAGEQSIIFTIDNSASSSWQPRNIENYAQYMEHERTYPAGARFEVTGRSREGDDIRIALRLLRK